MAHLDRATLARLFAKIRVDDNGCWRWVAAADRKGYGRVWFDGTHVLVHRLTCKYFGASFDDALDVDHLCRNPRCVNPAHLEAVPATVNRRRQAEAHGNACRRGHEYSPVNLIVQNGGKRACRICVRSAAARRRESRMSTGHQWPLTQE